jgi:hypothetical protein
MRAVSHTDKYLQSTEICKCVSHISASTLLFYCKNFALLPTSFSKRGEGVGRGEFSPLSVILFVNCISA